MARRGFDAVREVKAAMDEKRAQYGKGFTPKLSLKDGETCEGYFNGPEDEPLIVNEHTLKDGKDFETFTCAADEADEADENGEPKHAGCVGCYQVTAGDKRVGRPTPRAHFNFFDMRLMHKIRNEEKSAKAGEGRDRFDWIPCPDDGTCKLCRRKVERVMSGQKTVKFAMTWGQALAAKADSLKKRCGTCGGKVKVNEDTGKAYCVKGCGKKFKRASLGMAKIEISRTGASTDTAYGFQIQEVGEPPEEVLAAEAVDLEATNKPMSAAAMADLLGVPNPFKSKTKGQNKPADDDDDDGDEDDGKRKVKVVKKNVVKKAVKKAGSKSSTSLFDDGDDDADELRSSVGQTGY